ncbi:phosphotransferase family protein [Nocardia amikacinitolerans]|uniref:phosphotransferase family protein n=1 Tax=Nocardia amikacinitolerans TaxID=756689 RepID=UPI0020A5B186|nr:phosphotransferase [Nocardia amikacinitolerans]MCP2277239.1 Phosphotransferase enzyme family protein [Nocardia amikacinitolerans]
MTHQDIEPAVLTETTFTPRRTRVVLDAACRAAGLDATGAELLRHHTNAVYSLVSAPVVVKIGRPSRIGHVDVVGLVRWFEDEGVPTVPLADTDQPLDIGGCPITFWKYLDQRRGITSAAELAEPLAALHSRRTTPPVALPDDQITLALNAIARSIDASVILAPEDRVLLHARRLALARRAPDILFALDVGVIHGDAQHRNALWDQDRRAAVLCDWENAAIGPPEWDLVTIEVHCRRFGHPAAEYEAFARSYGLDIRDWDGYEWLRDLRELRMITTNARKCMPGSATAAEVLRRVAALRDDAPIRWNIL